MNVKQPVSNFLAEHRVPNLAAIGLAKWLNEELEDAELVVVATAGDDRPPLLVSLAPESLRTYELSLIAEEGTPEPFGDVEVTDYGRLEGAGVKEHRRLYYEGFVVAGYSLEHPALPGESLAFGAAHLPADVGLALARGLRDYAGIHAAAEV